MEGWIYRPSTSPTKRDGFDLVVSSEEGENLRRAPNGPIVGRAREGTLLERVGKQGKWFQVRREGWVPRSAVAARQGQGKQPAEAQGKQPAQGQAKPAGAAQVQQAAAKATAPAKARTAPVDPAPTGPAEGVEVSRETGLARAPGDEASEGGKQEGRVHVITEGPRGTDAKLVSVRLGLTDGVYTEVLDGSLKPGTRVAIGETAAPRAKGLF